MRHVNLLATVNPVARILAVIVLTTPLLLSIDWVSAGVSLLCTILLAPLCGVGWGRLIRRAWPLVVIAPISGVSMALYAAPEGREYASFFVIHVTSHSLVLAGAVMLRVLAIGLPVVVLSVDVDPTDMGDGLAQVLRLPARFVIGAIAGARLLTLFRGDWHALERARRSRGLADSGRVRHLVTMTFVLLVCAVRRGTKLATAMEARGFGAPVRRTWARESRCHARDYALVVVCALLAAVVLGCALYAGTFRVVGL